MLIILYQFTQFGFDEVHTFIQFDLVLPIFVEKGLAFTQREGVAFTELNDFVVVDE